MIDLTQTLVFHITILAAYIKSAFMLIMFSSSIKSVKDILTKIFDVALTYS